jgi:hypothetical protein
MVAFAPALAIPFAEAVGITITGLSLAAITDKVSQYVNQNPEESKAILKMILPASVTEQGLSTLFKKKAKSPEKEVEEVDSEDIDPQDLSREDKAKIMKEYGKSRGQNKRERMIEIAKQLGLVGEEKEKQKVFDEVEQRYENDEVEENIKPKFDYKRFFKADGGRIGFANGGRGYSDYASPSSTTASQDFATQAVSGGQTDYDGGGGGNDQPITEIRPNFNYNIDPFSINPRLNFKNIASIIYLQEFLDKKAKGEDVDLEADINFRDQFGNLDIFGNLGRSGNIVGANIPFLQSGIASLAYSPDTGLAAGLRGNLTEDLSGGVSFQDGQQNVTFNYDKGPFSADFTSGPEENNIQVGFKMPFADGGRIGYVGGGLATTQDFANALKSVSAGTTYQQQTQAKEYARNEAANELRAAIQGGGIDSFLGGAGLSNYRSMFPNDRAGTNRQGDFTGTYNARKEQLLDALMNKKLQFTSYAPPPPPTDSLTGMLESQMLPNMADGSMKSLAEQNAIRDRVLAAQKAQEESYYLTDPISGKKYTSQDEAINDLGLVTYNQRFADGGRIGYQAGGVATPEQYAAALQKVGAGTETQKRTSLGNYLGDYIATQGQKLGNAAVIPFQAAKGENQIKNSGKLSGNINYNDYGVKTNTQGNEFLGFGDRSFTDPEAALATTLGQASYSVDPKTGKITFTGGTAYDFGDDQFGGLGKFISKGGVFNQLPSVSNKFQPGATEYNPDITLGSDFMKQFNQPKYPDYKTAALQSQYYKNNPSNLDSDLFRAAYARALPDSGIKTRITNEGQVATDYGNYDPSRVYSAYMGNTGTSSSNPFFDQFKGSQYADMPTIMEAMYGTPGNMNPYYADGGLATMFRKKQ